VYSAVHTIGNRTPGGVSLGFFKRAYQRCPFRVPPMAAANAVEPAIAASATSEPFFMPANNARGMPRIGPLAPSVTYAFFRRDLVES